MTRAAAVVLRPEPGNARTAARLEQAGVEAIRQPLFATIPVAWTAPDPGCFDALMLTSANAVLYAGPGLKAVRDLPVIAVGTATAAAAGEAGLRVVLTGTHDAAALVAAARAQGFRHLLHLAGRDRIDLTGVDAITVYASDPLPIAPESAREWHDRVVLLHSARAARYFAALVDRDAADRARIAVAALSPAVRDAAGLGWAYAEAADQPDDTALVALALTLIDHAVARGDKQSR